MTWRNRAACAETDPEIFYPDYRVGDRNLKARLVCATCPVRKPCLEDAYASAHSRTWGVRAGTTGAQRCSTTNIVRLLSEFDRWVSRRRLHSP